MRALVAILITVLLAGCGGKLKYVKPTAYGNIENSKTIAKPRDTVWNSAVRQLQEQSYVINNLDKASGLINLSHSGDPESFVDCGSITSYVENAREKRIYNFPGARAHQTFEVMDASNIFVIERKMSLEGRVTLIFEEIGPNSTKVTANTRYVLTRQVTARQVTKNIPQSSTSTISFKPGGGAAFPPDKDGKSIECVYTGKMERDILSLIE
jgi:hypothetical protein